MKEVSFDAVLALLNSAPVIRGQVQDALTDAGTAAPIVAPFGASTNAADRDALRAVRDDLQRVGHGDAAPATLDRHLRGVTSRPHVTDDGVAWELEGPADQLPAARAVLTWCAVEEELPGRLRPCGNPECTKFLLDRSRPNTAKWCSMAECGNRLKARRHASRQAS